MEAAGGHSDEAREPSVSYPVSIQRGMESLSLEVKVGSNTQKEAEEEDADHQQRIISLQRDLTTSVFNIQTAANAEVVRQRTQLEERKRRREQWLENDLKSCQDISAELATIYSTLQQKATNQELKELLDSQQQLGDSIIQGKYALIKYLQEELKRADKRHVEILNENAKQINLMCERMEDQVKMERAAYREKLDQTMRFHQQEKEILLAKHVAEWERVSKDIRDKELEKQMEQRKKVEADEERICQMKLETPEYIREVQAHLKVPKKPEGEHKQFCDRIMKTITQKKQTLDRELEMAVKAKNKRKTPSLKTELRKLEEEELKEDARKKKLDKRLKEKYERLQKQIKHFSVTNAKKSETMYQMIDKELKELAERALTIDSVICKNYLGIAWERPQMACLEHSSPIQPQKQAARLSQPQLQTEKPREEKNLLRKKQMEVLELLCGEADFLIEPKVLKVLASQQKEEQTGVKLHLLCDVLKIKDRELPTLADFLLAYGQQHREQTEDACAESSSMAEAAESSSRTNSISDLIHPDQILPALLSFLEQRKRENSDHHLSSSDYAQSLNTSKDLSHWESLGNVISEDKLKHWDRLEETLKQYYSVLTDISHLAPDIERLTQRNTQLRMKLEQGHKGYPKP